MVGNKEYWERKQKQILAGARQEEQYLINTI